MIMLPFWWNSYDSTEQDLATRPSVQADKVSQHELPPDRLAANFIANSGQLNAKSHWARGHAIQAFILADIALLFVLYGWQYLIIAVTGTVYLLLLCIVVYRLFAVSLALLSGDGIAIQPEDVNAIEQAELPIYTILVPLYKEANIAGSIVRSLSLLRYPRNKLDIKLLLEEDDQVTRSAVADLGLGAEFDLVVLPPTYPRTKPKACNYGLARSRGDYVVIYDAEDRPDPDQLLKALYLFGESDNDVACVQAKLNYFNARDNFLTKCFAIEYAVWFDLYLPGLQILNAPIPLGGTSNHFRREFLNNLNGWDPFNVTEDCDIGVRLSAAAGRTILMESTTWEEANLHLGNWIRQRSRWVKGYMQTHLVHTKSMLDLLRNLGIWRSLQFFLIVGGNAIVQLLYLPLLVLSVVYASLLVVDLWEGRDLWAVVAGSRDEYRNAWKLLYLDTGENAFGSAVSLIGFVGGVILLGATAILIQIALIGCYRRGFKDLWWVALLSPLYWILGSVAAWKGAWQLLIRPHYWEKTVHGLTDNSSDNESVPAVID